jgi:hypothetical protein
LFVLPAPHQIDGFGEMFGNVKFIEHDFALCSALPADDSALS